MQSEHKNGMSKSASQQYSGVVGEFSSAIQPQTGWSDDEDLKSDTDYLHKALPNLIKLTQAVIKKSSSKVNVKTVSDIKKRLEQFDDFMLGSSVDISSINAQLSDVVEDIVGIIDTTQENQTFKSASEILNRMKDLNKRLNERAKNPDEDDAIPGVMGLINMNFFVLSETVLAEIDNDKIGDQLLPKLKAMETRVDQAYEAFDALNVIKAYTQLIDNLLTKKTFFAKGLEDKTKLLTSLKNRLQALRAAIRGKDCSMDDSAKGSLITITKELAIVTHHRRHSIMDNFATLFRWLLVPFFCLGSLFKNRSKADSWRAFEDQEKNVLDHLPNVDFNNQLRRVYHEAIANKNNRTVEMVVDEKANVVKVNSYNAYRALLFSMPKQANTTVVTQATKAPAKKAQPAVTATEITARRSTLKDMNLRVPAAAPLVPKVRAVTPVVPGRVVATVRPMA